MKLVSVIEGALVQHMISGGFQNMKVLDVSKKTGLIPQQIISVFKGWEKKGAGRFIKGSRGVPSRFETAPLLFIMKTVEIAGQTTPELQQMRNLEQVVQAFKNAANPQ